MSHDLTWSFNSLSEANFRMLSIQPKIPVISVDTWNGTDHLIFIWPEYSGPALTLVHFDLLDLNWMESALSVYSYTGFVYFNLLLTKVCKKCTQTHICLRRYHVFIEMKQKFGLCSSRCLNCNLEWQSFRPRVDLPHISQGQSAPHLSHSAPRNFLMYFSLNSHF